MDKYLWSIYDVLAVALVQRESLLSGGSVQRAALPADPFLDKLQLMLAAHVAHLGSTQAIPGPVLSWG